jgi:hypothetical protein
VERQHSLPIFPDPHHLPIEPRDRNVQPEARPRLSRQSREVLERLRKGPASNADLAAITHRFGGRIWDLRKARCVIQTEQDARSGLATYTLKYLPDGLIPENGESA